MVTGTAYAEEEYTIISGGYSKGDATTIGFGTNYVTSVDGLTGDNALYFTFTTPAKKGIFNIYQTQISNEEDLDFYITDTIDDTILSGFFGGWCDGVGENISLSPSTTYYLRIENESRGTYSSNSGNIKFRVSYTYDFGGDTMSSASNISHETTYTAYASGIIDEDWFKFYTDKYTEFLISANNIGDSGNGCENGCSLKIELYNSVEEYLLGEALYVGAVTNSSISLQKNKNYYIRVFHTDAYSCQEDGFSDAYQFNISPVRTPISSTSIKLSSTAYTYNGKAKTPTVTVKYAGKTLTKNVDYKVSYSNNTAAGIGKVTITGIGAYKGTTTKTFTIKLPKVTGLKQKNYSTKQVTLTWNKVNKATGYDIFRKDTKTGSYKYIGSTSSTKYTNKELKAGKTYYYVVRAFLKSNGKRVVSGVNSSSLTTTTRPAAPKLTVSSGSKYAKLNWKKVNGGSGYLVYMSTSKNGTYKLMATIGGKASKIATVGKTSITYKQKSLTKGKTYYFKMRSYKTTPSGNKVYSYGYSPIVSVKIK